MKKIYIAPEALIIDIETQFVIANSNVDSTRVGSGYAPGHSGRSRDPFDDEDEDLF